MTRIWDYVNCEKLLTAIIDSLEKLYKNDKYLITKGIHEQAIAHRLWVYLEAFWCDNYQIDCEYNNYWGSNNKIFNMNISQHEFKKCDIIVNGQRIAKKWDIILKESWYGLVYYSSDTLGNTFLGKIFNDTISLKTLKSSNIRPDIIIHKRWLNKNGDNLCIFEVKKGKLDLKDKVKLIWFTREDLNFQYKYWIWFSKFNEEWNQIDVYVNGCNKWTYYFSSKTWKIENNCF